MVNKKKAAKAGPIILYVSQVYVVDSDGMFLMGLYIFLSDIWWLNWISQSTLIKS